MRFFYFFLIIVSLLCCKSKESDFNPVGVWRDDSCKLDLEYCNSRFQEIVIKESPDSLKVRTGEGIWKNVVTLNKWHTYYLELENGHISLLFPNYKKNTLQYYDSINNRFIYYTKIKSI